MNIAVTQLLITKNLKEYSIFGFTDVVMPLKGTSDKNYEENKKLEKNEQLIENEAQKKPPNEHFGCLS